MVYTGIIEAHRRAIDATEELDPVTQDMLIEQSGELEQYHWFVRAHLEAPGRIAHHRERQHGEDGGREASQDTAGQEELSGCEAGACPVRSERS